MVGTAGLPHVIVRFYTVPKVRQARSSAGWALLFIAILYTTAPAVAAFARTNVIATVSERPYAEVPAWFTNWETTGLIAFDDKNGDGVIQYTGPASDVPNELTIDRDIMVLANPEIARLPPSVVGLVAGRRPGGGAVDGREALARDLDLAGLRSPEEGDSPVDHRAGRAAHRTDRRLRSFRRSFSGSSPRA